MKRGVRIIKWFLLSVLILVLILWMIRFVMPRQLDDVSPEIGCSDEIIGKSDILTVVPLFNNKSIAEDRVWCDHIVSLNKTLVLHGVYHSYKEFDETRSEEYIDRGAKEFEKCFGFYPERFEAPQMALSDENEKTLKKMGFSIIGKSNEFIRKVYHCQEEGEFKVSVGGITITNRLIDFF